MMNESVKILRDALEDGTIGLAVQLAAVPIESGDSQPTMPTLYDESTDGEASRDQFPDGAGPFLLISTRVAEPVHITTRPAQPDNLDVIVRYGLRAQDTAEAVRTASYTLRSVRRCLAQLMTTTAGAALRVRNQAGLFQLSDVQYGPLSAPAHDTPVAWALTCKVAMVDTWAST